MQEEVVPREFETKPAPEPTAPTISKGCKLALKQTPVVEPTSVGGERSPTVLLAVQVNFHIEYNMYAFEEKQF